MEDQSAVPSRCGEALVAALEARGVDTVFGIPGVHTQEIYRGLSQSGIRHILARNEQGAGLMACGYARASGRPGVCVLITGPGVTNAATALGQAWADSLPVLVVSSDIESGLMGAGLGELHEVTDQAAVTRPLTGLSVTALRVEDVPDMLDQVFHTLAGPRSRPAHLSVPIDILASEVSTRWPPPVAPPALPQADAGELASAARRLLDAERPVICVGGGAAGATVAVRALAERLDAPVLASHAGKGVMPAGHPLDAGSAVHLEGGQGLLANADVVLAIGTELAWTDSFVPRLPINGALIRIDVDRSKFDDRYRAVVALRSDAGVAATALLDAVGDGRANAGDGSARTQAARTIDEGNRTELERRHCKVLDAIRAALPANGILCADSTQLTYTAQRFFEVAEPRRWLYGAGFCTLGGGLPEAIGAKLACPHTPVMAMAGDAGFLFTVQELATAVELGLALPILVWNNDGLAQIRDGMIEGGFTPTGVASRNPDFLGLARAFGCRTARPGSAAELGACISNALVADGPTLIEVHETDGWLGARTR